MSENNAGSKLTFFLAGLGVGAILTLLFAPASGEESRKFLSDRADEGREFVSGKGRELRQQAGELVGKAKDLVNQQKEQLSAALEAGKQAYQDEKANSR